MFILHSSNKTENLLEHLTTVIETAPLSSPFAKETFLIQSQGMERWLSQQLATKLGVWGNFEYLFPSRFFSMLARQIDSHLDDAVFERELMLWRFESLLRRLEEPVFMPLRRYLSGDNASLKRYQLAAQLTQLFDQYQLLRPDMLAAWQQGRDFYATEHESWQQALWQRVLEATDGNHRGALWLEVIAKLEATPAGGFGTALPERVSVFGVNTMPPLFLNFLQALARHGQVHLYLLNPAQTYWADLRTKRQRQEDIEGHPLLSALGQQGREFQEMLLDQVQFELELDSFESDEIGTNLQRLQRDILNNQVTETVLVPDASLTVHACHSRMREVEVLKNLLLDALEQDPELELRDIVVMAPDIERYEPFIAAVFDDIQHAIADRSLRLSNPALDAFISFLNLSQSRFGWLSVLDLLENPLIYPGFGLSETDLELVKYWIRETHVRWGRSARHRSELDLPAFDENTWEAGLERLLLGYAFGSDGDFVELGASKSGTRHDILPYIDIEGGSAQALGGLHDFLQLLFKAGDDLRRERPLAAWGERLYDYADALLAGADPWQRQQLNELLAELSETLAAVHQERVELQVIVHWLQSRLDEHKSATGFLRGQLTFCSMLPMRSIPFKVIALLGMNDGEFPKIDRKPAFDLLSSNFRKGDRSRRADDRYQFLEILLSARRRLIITYIGQSISQNEAIPPSVVVGELLDVLKNHYALADPTVRHPLQGFSHRYFDGSRELFSYSQADRDTAAALVEPKAAPTPWWQGRLDAGEAEQSDEAIVEISELLAFFRHPQKYFLQRRLDLVFDGIEAEAEEREPFAIGALDAYAIAQDWIASELNGSPLSVQRLQAQGRWLPGSCGDLEFDRQRTHIDAFVERIKSKSLGSPLDEATVDLRVGRYRLLGKLGNRYRNGGLFYRFADLKGKDLLIAWLHHLIINAMGSEATHLLSIDEDLLFLPEYCGRSDLEAFLEIYREGLSRPDVFFVEPALAYLRQAVKLEQSRRATKPALAAAAERLAHSIEQPYETELRTLFSTGFDAETLLRGDFETYCRSLLQPVWQATHR